MTPAGQLGLFTPPAASSYFPVARPGAAILPAQVALEEAIEEGSACPCCGQFVKLYKRRLNSTMARGLIWLVREATAARSWVYVSRNGPKWLVSKGGTLATLSHWRLIEPKLTEEGETQKRCSGVWRPTAKGVDWTYGRLTVPARVHLYNATVVGWSEEHSTIREALGARFDYYDLMGWTPPGADEPRLAEVVVRAIAGQPFG